MTIKLSTPTPFNLRLTALSHGWVNLPPFSWNGDRLSWVQRGIEPRAYQVAISQPRRRELHIEAQAATPLTLEERRALLVVVRRVLNLDLDLREFLALAKQHDRRIARLIAMGGGRLLRGTSVFEDLTKTLFTTNASWEHTVNQTAKIIERFGQRSEFGKAFPSATDMQHATESDLRSACRIGYRAPYLVRVVRACVSNKALNDGASLLNERTFSNRPLRGFGPYAFSHVRVLLNEFSQVPWDCEVKRYAQQYLRIRAGAEQQMQRALHQRFEPWGQWKFLAFKCERKILKANWLGD